MEPAWIALNAVTFKPYHTKADIWRDDIVHVDGLQQDVLDDVDRALGAIRAGLPAGNLVVQGRPGIGKSHLLGQMRRHAIGNGNFFALIELAGVGHFWESVVSAYLDALFRQTSGDSSQLKDLLSAVARAAHVPAPVSDLLMAGTFGPEQLSVLKATVAKQLGPSPANRTAVDVAVSLYLLQSESFEHQEIGHAFLQGQTIEADEAKAHGFFSRQIAPRAVIAAFDRLFKLVGKAALASIDQLDGVIALDRALNDGVQQTALDQVANDLMTFAQDSQRTLIVLASLPTTWELIKSKSISSAADRFPVNRILGQIPSVDVGRALIAAHLAPAFERAKFVPPYPTWPIKPESFAESQFYTARELIKLTDDHIRRCRDQKTILELESFSDVHTEAPAPTAPYAGGVVDPPDQEPVQPEAAPATEDALTLLDQQFAILKANANIKGALDPESVDLRLPPLLRAGLQAWIAASDPERRFEIDPPPGQTPALHAKLRQVLNADQEDELWWSFRAITHSHGAAALTRIKSAMLSSGVGERRMLFLLRNEPWSKGLATQDALHALARKGGRTLGITEADLNILAALMEMQTQQPAALLEWTRSRKPTSSISFFDKIAAGPKQTAGRPPQTGSDGEVAVARAPSSQSSLYEPVINDMVADRRNLFLTGKAGTGKSTLLRAFVNRERQTRGVAVVAPTGIAAVNANGETIHRFFKLPLHYLEPGDVKLRRSAEFWDALTTLVIDEVSMVRADLMRAIDLSLQRNRKNRAPFGGVRLVLIGDLGQLPPIVAEDELKRALRDNFGGIYFHNWEGVDRCLWKVIELRHVFRQENAKFVEILDGIRSGHPSAAILASLNNEARDTPKSDAAIILTTRNGRATEINAEKLDALQGHSRSYTATIEGDFPESAHPTDAILRLKVNARVMILRNDPVGRWANGTIATVSRLSDNRVWVRIADAEHELEPWVWERFSYEYDPEAKTVKPKVDGKFRQMPLRLAWALTIHKSQGLSFDAVHVDLPQAAWAHGQLYVALSRCRTLEGLSLSRRIHLTDIVFDDPAFSFLKNVPLSTDATAGVGIREAIKTTMQQ